MAALTMPNKFGYKGHQHTPIASAHVHTPAVPVPEAAHPAGPDIPWVEGDLSRYINDALHVAERNPLLLFGAGLLISTWLVVRFR